MKTWADVVVFRVGEEMLGWTPHTRWNRFRLWLAFTFLLPKPSESIITVDTENSVWRRAK